MWLGGGIFGFRGSKPLQLSCVRCACVWVVVLQSHHALQARGFLASPTFLPTADTVFIEFAFRLFYFSPGLELQYKSADFWRRCWSHAGHTGFAWRQAKVTLPAGIERLRFVKPRSDIISAYVDAVVAGQPDAPAADFLALCSGQTHSCAVHIQTGQLRCWGGLGSPIGITSPHLLGEGNEVRQVACGNELACAVLSNGVMQCWGASDNLAGIYVEAGPTSVDVGTDQSVEQVGCGYVHVCALLHSGIVKCFSKPNYGLEYGLPSVDLGTNFTAVQLAVGWYHACAVSSQGTLRCWGRGPGTGLGLTKYDSIGQLPNEMGDFLPTIDLGLDVVQVSAGHDFTCAAAWL